MQNRLLAEKYPIHLLELEKSETPHQTLDQLLQALEAKAEQDPGVALIAIFDHYSHTKLVGGEIRQDIIAAKTLIFCFGPSLPDPSLLAIRPRSIGIAELPDRFVISFLEAPLPPANKKMTEWVLSLRTVS